MTDQPTWTPERALAMLRDWKGISVLKFNAKWPGVEDIDEVAIAALESAAAEIAKEKARADAAEKEREHLARIIGDHLDEIERLRAELALRISQRDAATAEIQDLRATLVRKKDDATAWEAIANARLQERNEARAELAAKQPETRTPLPEAKFSRGPTHDADQLTGRALDEAAARAMGWTTNKWDAWYDADGYWRSQADGPKPTEREMLAWLHSKAGWGAFLRLESSMVDCPEPWSAERSGDCYVPICHGRDLREALARLVVAVAAREAKA